MNAVGMIMTTMFVMHVTRFAMRRIVARTREKMGDQPVNVGVVHALAAEQAELLLTLARANLHIQDCYVKDLALSLAVHFGPGTVGLVAYPIDGDY